MSDDRIQTDGLRKVAVLAAKLWAAAQVQRRLERYRKKIAEYVDRSLMRATVGPPVNRLRQGPRLRQSPRDSTMSFLLRGVGWRYVFALMLSCAASPAWAGGAMTPNAGDTAWVLVASALVLFMTFPGLVLFYGGLARARKNRLSVLMHCFGICCIVSLLWAGFGYSLSFGHGGALIGPLDNAFLVHFGNKELRSNLPEVVFLLFQMTFAVITSALIIGAFPERVRFPFVLLFTMGWLVIVYLPVTHWVWGGGWAAAAGVIDFAGGISLLADLGANYALFDHFCPQSPHRVRRGDSQ
ncbi:hypothetical protein QA640_32615 [Bradyrhizobium sp. CB82]|uniref:ammonium transporter n=1 Tax=Bradyrhizobium sp. CB82 TaxID=3039159 RepID=UPI0024B1803E|nr:hypothetical protein [Bradyrhizobium sp. CB82]WFU39099.1 hypothetical protein QA640_32615 [Bradyrhizobium sp. CB82]